MPFNASSLSRGSILSPAPAADPVYSDRSSLVNLNLNIDGYWDKLFGAYTTACNPFVYRSDGTVRFWRMGTGAGELNLAQRSTRWVCPAGVTSVRTVFSAAGTLAPQYLYFQITNVTGGTTITGGRVTLAAWPQVTTFSVDATVVAGTEYCIIFYTRLDSQSMNPAQDIVLGDISMFPLAYAAGSLWSAPFQRFDAYNALFDSSAQSSASAISNRVFIAPNGAGIVLETTASQIIVEAVSSIYTAAPTM